MRLFPCGFAQGVSRLAIGYEAGISVRVAPGTASEQTIARRMALGFQRKAAPIVMRQTRR